MYCSIAALVHEQEHNLRKVHISTQAAFPTSYAWGKFTKHRSLACKFRDNKHFIFRYEVTLTVGAASNRWYKTQLNASKRTSWCAMTTRGTWSHQKVRSVIRLLRPPTYSDVGLWNNESASYQETVQKVRKQSNGPSMTMTPPVGPAEKGRLWTQNELKNSLEPREIAVRDLSAALETSITAIHNTVRDDLEYREVSACWVPRSLKEEQKYRIF